MRWWWIAGGAAVVLVGLGLIGAIARDDEFNERLGVTVGDCVPDVLPAETTEELATIPCSEPHAGEVFALVRDGAGDAEPYPGEAAMLRRASQGCVDAFPAYAGMTLSDAGLDLMSNSPSQDSWEQAGDRVTICLLRAVEGDLIGSRRQKPPDGPLPAERTLDTLTAGDCFSSERLSAGEGTAAVELADCATPHTFEVFATTDAPDDIDHEEVDRFAQRSCIDLFDSYVGVPYVSSVLTVAWIAPSPVSWNTDGNRRSICLVSEANRDLVGTVRNTKR